MTKQSRGWQDHFADYRDRHGLGVPESWRPVDLGPILAGDHVRAKPGIGLTRADGLALLYPGKEHTIIGEMESGKSWFAAGSVVAELTKGNHVVYVHFEEADASDTVDRLRALGVLNDVIRARFWFIGPHELVTAEALAALLAPAPSLVVLDGVNEAMSLHGMKIRDEDGAAAYRRVLVKPCTAVGAAVLSADHVVKDRQARGRDPLGSIHKGNGLTGSLIELENVEAFGRGRKGASHVFVNKDRPGYLRQHGRPSKLPGRTYIGTLVVDDTREWRQYLDLAFLEPKEQEVAAPQGDADEAAVLAAIVKLTDSGQQRSIRQIRATAGISNARAADALTRLALRGAVTKTIGSGNAHLFDIPSGSESRFRRSFIRSGSGAAVSGSGSAVPIQREPLEPLTTPTHGSGSGTTWNHPEPPEPNRFREAQGVALIFADNDSPSFRRAARGAARLGFTS